MKAGIPIYLEIETIQKLKKIAGPRNFSPLVQKILNEWLENNKK